MSLLLFRQQIVLRSLKKLSSFSDKYFIQKAPLREASFVILLACERLAMSNEIWTIKDILDWCEDYLTRNNDAQPRLSAQWLLSEATGLSRIDLYTNFDKPLTTEERATMREWVRRRAQGEPLQLICGTAPFRYLTLKVAPGVLIPRPETEVLVSEAFGELNLQKTCDVVVETEEGSSIISPQLAPVRVLDLCTGSGCIACAIASEYPAAQVLATDIAPEALALAKENVQTLDLTKRVSVLENNLMQGFAERYKDSFDLIISNPPYIPTEVVQNLDREVKDFEPTLALDGGADGLDLYRNFINDAFICLVPGGVFAVELHETCLDEAAALAHKTGFEKVRIVQDLAGRDRILIARKPL